MRWVAAAMKTLGERPVAERRAVVLGQVVGVEAGVLVALDEREALLELLADRKPTLVDVIEDPDFMLLPPSRPGTTEPICGLTCDQKVTYPLEHG